MITLLGFWSGLIGFVTQRYTSTSCIFVREIDETQKWSAAAGSSTASLWDFDNHHPVVCIGIMILVARSLCAMFGVALETSGMLGTLTM